MRISPDARSYARQADPAADPAVHFQAGLNFAKSRERSIERLAKQRPAAPTEQTGQTPSVGEVIESLHLGGVGSVQQPFEMPNGVK